MQPSQSVQSWGYILSSYTDQFHVFSISVVFKKITAPRHNSESTVFNENSQIVRSESMRPLQYCLTVSVAWGQCQAHAQEPPISHPNGALYTVHWTLYVLTAVHCTQDIEQAHCWLLCLNRFLLLSPRTLHCTSLFIAIWLLVLQW